MRNAKHAATLEWASNVAKMYPYRPKAVRMQEALKEQQLRDAAGKTTPNSHLTKI
jgi:hypothetical protein